MPAVATIDLFTRVNAWIVATLRADTLLMAAVGNRVYEAHFVPANDPLPHVVYQKLAGTDYGNNGGRRYKTEFVYIVKAQTMANSFSQIKDLADWINADLHGKNSILFQDIEVVECLREQALSDVDPEDGKGDPYPWAGGQYRITAAPN